jgi:hypothetical protein
MPLETLFSIANLAVLPGWLLVAIAPGWRWSQRYVWLLANNWGPGGFSSLEQVALLFSNRALLLAGWIHYLIFDLFTGSWESRDALAHGIPRWVVTPCLVLTFLLGPVGLAVYLLARAAWRRHLDPFQTRP